MRIALFHDFLVRMGGAEHVLFTFADMFPDAEIHTLFADKDAIAKKYPEVKHITLHPGAQRCYDIMKSLPVVGRQATKLLLPWYARWVEEMNFEQYDLVIISSTAWALGVIAPLHTPTVCYIHSPARFLWDYYPAYKRELGVKQNGDLKDIILTSVLSPLRLWNKLAGDRPTHLICNAETVQRRVEKFYRRDDSVVIHPPVDTDQLHMSGAHPSGDFLLISTLSPYKNIDALLKWWGTREAKLCIVGDGPDRSRLEKLAPKNVEFAGYVSNDKRNQLLEEARAVMYPSMEDFGIVPIEAMAAGKLTLALGRGGATETLKEGSTGIFFDSLDEADLEDAWARFVELEKNYDPLVLRASAEKFGTPVFKKKILGFLRENGIRL